MAQKSSSESKKATEGQAEAVSAEEAARELQQLLKNDPLLAFRGVLTENDTLRKLAVSNNRLFMVTFFGFLLAIAAAWAGWARDVEFRYFYINEEGHVYETHGLKYPVATHARVNNFARDIAVQVHTWTYKNYMDVFTDLQDLCRTGTITQYYNTLGNGGVFTTAQRYSQRYDGSLVRSRVENEWVIDESGRKGWRVHLVVNEDITGTGRPVQRQYDMVIDVEQVPLSVTPRGLRCIRIDENYKERS